MEGQKQPKINAKETYKGDRIKQQGGRQKDRY
jgi:hypothetical protein